MTDHRFQEGSAPRLGRALADAAASGRSIPVSPLVRYAEDAACIFAGVETALDLLQADSLARLSDEEPRLSEYQTENLIDLLRASARLMVNEASRIQAWADRHVGAPAQEAQP